MVSTALINGGLGFVMLVTLVYNMGYIRDVLNQTSWVLLHPSRPSHYEVHGRYQQFGGHYSHP